MASDTEDIRESHYHPTDPGITWKKDSQIALDSDSTSGEVNLLSPNVIHLPRGGYRMFYSVLGSVQDYENSRGNIRSAFSKDGETWRKEPGVRMDVHESLATQRVLSPDVVQLLDGHFRMYYEAKPNGGPSCILSAISDNAIDFFPELGVRVGDNQNSYGAPRCVYVPTPTGSGLRRKPAFRLYFQRYSHPFQSGLEAGNHIQSAIADDGIDFDLEPGVRIKQETEDESYAASAPEVIRLRNGTWRMYFAGWRKRPLSSRIFTAVSRDGLTWEKDRVPCVDIGGEWDNAKISEPCIIDVGKKRYRMFYEACDRAGQWRIASATSVKG